MIHHYWESDGYVGNEGIRNVMTRERFKEILQSKMRYFQEMDMYLGKKQQVEHSLGEGVVLQLSQKLNDTYCTLFFDNFFNSPSLVETLYQCGIYGIGTVRKDRKHMPSMVPDKAMKRGDHEFQHSDKAISCKWFDNRAVHFLGSNVE